MSDTQSPPTSSQVTDEDLITAVRQQCEKAGVPVVPTKKVTEAEQIDVTSQTVKRRLEDIDVVNSMQVGRGHVWWVPEDEEEARGKVDMSSVYLEELDPEDLPRELIEQHPEGPATDWEKMRQQGGHSMWLSWLAVAAGFLMVAVSGTSIVQGGPMDVIGPVLVVGGLAIFLVGLIFWSLGLVFDRLDAPQPMTVLRKRSEPLRDWIADTIAPD